MPIGDIVLIDFAGDGRNVTADEISKVNAANGGYVVMRNGEQFNASLQDFTGKPLIAVFSNGRRSNIGDVARIYLGSVSNVPGFPTQSASNPSVAPNNRRCPNGRPAGAAAAVVRRSVRAIAPPHRQTPDPSWCRRTCSGPTPA